jgi:DNA-binding beta-propeller fold protein YncE
MGKKVLRLIFRSFCIVLLPVLAGCAGNSARNRPQSGVELRWPPPPAEARIVLSGEISEPGDLGIGKGFWNRLVEMVSGEKKSRIVRPYGVYDDGAGRIYVTDPGAGVVHLYDTAGGRYARLAGTAETPLQVPIGVSGDGKGMAYITDSASGIVFRHGGDDDSLTPFIKSGLTRPTGIAFNRQSGRIYVADSVRHQIVVFDTAGKELFRIGSRGVNPGQFNSPTDLWIDRQGRLLVTDPLNFRVQILTGEGRYLGGFGIAGERAGEIAKPKGVAMDSDGHVYLADALLDAVQIFDEKGGLFLKLGTRGDRAGEFWMPAGLFIAANDTIYVADAYNNRVQIFRYRPPGAAKHP